MASKADSQFPLTRKYLTEYGRSVVDEMKTRLTNAGKEATGTLHKSLKFRTQETEDEFTISFFMADYGVYVDKGVKPQPQYLTGKGTGKSKFIAALKKWCKVKGIPQNAAFPIRRNIWKFGIKPTNFFTISTTRRQKQFEEMIARNMAKDMENLL